MAKITQQGNSFFVDGKPATPEQTIKIKTNLGGIGGGGEGTGQQALRKLLGQTPEEEFGQFKQRQDYLRSIKTQEQKTAPPPAEKKGLISSQKYWVERLNDIPSLVFPEGEYDAGTVRDASLKIPTEKGTELRRIIMRNIEMNLRAETGAAAQQSEIDRLTDSFMANILDSPKMFLGKINDLHGQSIAILEGYGTPTRASLLESFSKNYGKTKETSNQQLPKPTTKPIVKAAEKKGDPLGVF